MGIMFCGKHLLLLTRILVMGPLVYLSHGLVWGCDTELSHMGKSKGNNPDLVCEKKGLLV